MLELTNYQKGYIEALRSYSHMKDGVSYVGTIGTTLKQAIKEFLTEQGYTISVIEDYLKSQGYKND